MKIYNIHKTVTTIDWVAGIKEIFTSTISVGLSVIGSYKVLWFILDEGSEA